MVKDTVMCQVAKTDIIAVNAFINSKDWQSQPNPNHKIQGKIKKQAKDQATYKQVFKKQNYGQ